jgi:WD40 repeat protein
MEQGSDASWVGVSPSGAYVASATSDSNVRVWRAATGELVATIATGGAVEAAAFSPDERRLVTWDYELEETAIWDLPAGTRAWAIPIATSAGVVFAPNDRELIIAGADGDGDSSEGKLAWWDQDRRVPARSVSLDGFVDEMVASADRGRIATSAGAIARVWDTRTRRELRQMPYDARLQAIAISADGRWLASKGWNIGDGRPILEVTEIWAADPVAAVCARVQRNLTREEWGEYIGVSAPWRATCPGVDGGAEE